MNLVPLYLWQRGKAQAKIQTKKGTDKVSKNGKEDETNDEIIGKFAKKHKIHPRAENVFVALCSRADVSDKKQCAVSVTSDEGQRIAPYLNSLGYQVVSKALRRVITRENGEIVFAARVKATHMQKAV